MAGGPVVRVPERDFQLISPHPLADALPGVYRDAWIDDRARNPGAEPFGPRFLAAFDDLLAPILAAIDNLDAYLDPGTTPADFLVWLGGWVAAVVDETWTETHQRAFVADASELYRRRGTSSGLKDHLAVHVNGTVQVIENGASAWSPTPGGKLPGTPAPLVVVRVGVDDPSTFDQGKLAALVQAAKPAHVPHRVEVVGTTPASSARGKAGPPVVDAGEAGEPPASTKPAAPKPSAARPPAEDGSA